MIVAALAACTAAPETSASPPPGATPTPQKTVLPELTAQNTAASSEIESPAPTPAIVLTATPVLRIWLPPQFDPSSGSAAGEMLRRRLEEFTQEHPGVEIQVRIKALAGPGGLLDSLSAASAAAPLAMPDLIALPRELLEVAALKGLLRPIDNLTEALEAPDWYEYAVQLSRLQDSAFGLPFAGDALALVYRLEKMPAPPADWAAALETQAVLAFPAGDPLALFTVAQYQASAGDIRDDEGRPFLAVEPLNAVLDFYMRSEQAGLMPYWLTQFQSDEQVWQAFMEGRVDMAATWSSRYLSTLLSANQGVTETVKGEVFAFAPLPTPDGQPFTLATGWLWALASPNREKYILSIELAEFLCQAEFLARWTEAAGYLPPRANALGGWEHTDLQPLVSQVARSAVLYPATDISTPLGAVLQEAVIQILKKQIDPSSAAQAAAEHLTRP